MHAEVRGRGRVWRVFIPDAGQMAHSVPLYDQDGLLKETLLVGTPPTGQGIKYVECYEGPFASIEAATEYANYLGFTEVKVVRPKTKAESLELARKARSKR
jgi:hypothetical protein